MNELDRNTGSTPASDPGVAGRGDGGRAMTGMTRAALDAIRGRVEAATEGPWHSHDFGYAGEEEPSSIVVHVGRFDHSDLRTHDTETAVAWMPRWEGQESDNATFIAHARTDVPDLLAEVERLRRLIEERRTGALTKIIDRARQAQGRTLHRLEDAEEFGVDLTEGDRR